MHPIRTLGFIVLAATAVAGAQVPVTQEPRHRLAFENRDFRILDVNIPAGGTSLDHWHEFDIATVAISDGAITRARASGQPPGQTRPPRAAGSAEVTDYAGKRASHVVENTGTTPYQLFAVENLRTNGWSTAPPATGLATRLAAESRAFRVYDVRLAGGTPQTSHTHRVPTIAVLVSGIVMSDGPDAQAKTYAPAAVGLKQLTQPGQWLLVPGGDTHHLVRLGVGDAHVVEIEVR